MKPLTLLALLLGLSSLSITAHAEGGCPPGWMPYSSTSINSCGLIPGYDEQQQTAPEPRPPRWESRWGAIATDGKKGILGVASGAPSQSIAERIAIADCHAKGGDCKLQVSYANSCGVMVVDEGGFNVGNAATLDQAVQSGMKVCHEAGAANCRVYYSTCSPPVRIQ